MQIMDLLLDCSPFACATATVKSYVPMLDKLPMYLP
jgi:hypothetical protein